MLRFLPLVLLTCLTLAHAQPAQPWTLQTSAFRDAELAASAVALLREVGFDAYSERSQEVVRVRVGCFLDRVSAEDVAASLAQRVDVQVVPLSTPPATTPVTFCVQREAGFLLPATWGIANNTPASITFWIDAAGRRYLRFDASGWRIYQNASRMETEGPVVPERGQQRRVSQNAPFRVNSLLVGTGEPLWRSTSTLPNSASDSAQTLVVRGDDEIFTLTLTPPELTEATMSGENE